MCADLAKHYFQLLERVENIRVSPLSHKITQGPLGGRAFADQECVYKRPLPQRPLSLRLPVDKVQVGLAGVG